MSQFECGYCKKGLKSRQNLELHHTRCKVRKSKNEEQLKLENDKLKNQVTELSKENNTSKDQVTELSKENAMLKEQVTILQNQIFEIAKRPTTTTTNNTTNNNQRTIKIINHLAPYDLEDRGLVEEIAEMYFTKDTFEKGPEGIAKMIGTKFMTDEMTEQPKIVCTDPSRLVFRYKDKKNKLQRDDKLKKTHSLLSEPLNQLNWEFKYRHDTAESYPFEENRKFLEKRKTFTSTMMGVGVPSCYST